MLVALKVMSISAHLTDHVLQTGVACKHAVGTLDREITFRAEVSCPNENMYLVEIQMCLDDANIKLTGFECSTVKKSGLHRNLALGD